MWAGLYFPGSLRSVADELDQRGTLFGEGNWGEANANDANGRVFRAQAKAVRLASSRDLCAT